MELKEYDKKPRSAENGDIEQQMNFVIAPGLSKETSIAIKSNKAMATPPAAHTANKQWADIMPTLTKSSSFIDLETRQFAITIVSKGIEDLEDSEGVATALLSHSSSNEDSLDYELSPYGKEEPKLSDQERTQHHEHMSFYDELLGNALPGKRKFGKKNMHDIIGNLLNYIREEEAKGGDSEHSRRKILHHAHTLYTMINHTLRQTENETARELLKELARFIERVVKTYQDPASRIMGYIAGAFNIVSGALNLVAPIGLALKGLQSTDKVLAGLDSTVGFIDKFFGAKAKMKIPEVFSNVASGVDQFKRVNDNGIEGRRTELNSRIEEVKGFQKDSKDKADSHKNREDQIKQAQDRKDQQEHDTKIAMVR